MLTTAGSAAGLAREGDVAACPLALPPAAPAFFAFFLPPFLPGTAAVACCACFFFLSSSASESSSSDWTAGCGHRHESNHRQRCVLEKEQPHMR